MARNEGWMNRAIRRKREKIDFSKLNRSRVAVLFNLFGLWGTMRIHFDRSSVESEAGVGESTIQPPPPRGVFIRAPSRVYDAKT